MIGIILALALATSAAGPDRRPNPGPDPGPDPSITALQNADARVAAIAWRLQTANAALCSETAPLAGFSIQTLAQYSPTARATVAAQTGLGRQPGIQAVVAGGAADRAGLQAGDTLLKIDGVATPTDLPTRATYDATEKTQAMLDMALRSPPAVLQISRRRAIRTIEITGDTGCASRVEIVTERNLSAQADGQYVQISGSLVDFASNDDELAAVVAHELSHNILHHRIRLDSGKVSRGIFAGLGRGGAELRKTELEADRLAVWLLARADYDLDAIVPFWARLGRRTSYGILSDGTYPSWNDRIDRIASAVTEVKSQRALGVPLIPTGLPAQQSSSQAQFPR